MRAPTGYGRSVWRAESRFSPFWRAEVVAQNSPSRALRCGSSERYAHRFGVAANPLPVAIADGWQMEGVTDSYARSAS